jgi:hypothetical protein
LAQVGRLRGEVDLDRTRQQHHDGDLASSRASAATQLTDAPFTSIAIP